MALTDEIKALKLTIFYTYNLATFPYLGYGLASDYHDTALVRNQHQLPTSKTSKLHSLLVRGGVLEDVLGLENTV